jgi:Ca2+-binding RTX toxin-like protein
VNGDGFDDLIIGARYADPNGNYESGSSYVVFGKASGYSSNIYLSSLNGTTGFRLDGEAGSDKAGFSVSNAGDINGDGFGDVIVGAPGTNTTDGVSYVVFGKASGWSSGIDLSSLNGTSGFKLVGFEFEGYVGGSVSSAGDVNGDGLDDIIVGAKWASVNGQSSGSSYIVFGKTSGFASSINLSTLDGINGYRLDGLATTDLSGYSVSSAGDVNGDGFDDLIVGANNADPNGADSGSSYVIFGSNSNGAASHVGTSGNDTMTGTSSADAMIGGLGNDSISGGLGNDVIKGANGNDTITGGSGADRLWGGSGNDMFSYTANTDSGIGTGNRDVIHDFDTGNDDIDLSQFAGTAIFQTGGNGAADLTGSAFQVAFQEIGGNTRVFVDTDGNNVANFELQLMGVTDLSSSDFVL